MDIPYITVTKFFFFFSQYFCFTFGCCKEDTSTVHISAAKTEFRHALYKERAMRQELYKKKGVRPNEFQATYLPTRTFFFTTLTITSLRNSRHDKKKIAQAFPRASGFGYMQKQKKNLPTP
uniref:Uncharacterized protein n=1 Tax=Rhipicephalus zambeziensis TaxID=60191 RepID=A0A224Y5B0_9ACAR